MTNPATSTRPRRFPLFGKIVSGFALIIVFMILASYTFLVWMNDAFTAGESEFSGVQLTEYVERLCAVEHKAAMDFLESRDSVHSRTFERIYPHLVLSIDSLRGMIKQGEARSAADRLQQTQAEFEAFFRESKDQLKASPRPDQELLRQRAGAFRDSTFTHLRVLNDFNRSALIRSLNPFFKRARITINGGYITLALSFAVALAIAIILARTVIRPIRALQAGTQKVAEGVYETVPVSSSDEVADLTVAFNIMSEKLKQLDEMRIQLMSEISHEMRTPLQVIKAGCYSVIHSKDAPVLNQRQRDSIAMIHQATNRINTFVNSFLDIAKMEAGLMKFDFARQSIVELLTPLIQEAQLIAQTRDIKLEFTSEDIGPIQLDKDRIGQVFSNLLSNALKYTPDGGLISFRMTRPLDCDGLSAPAGGCVRIEVQDSGVGIPEADLARLFDKFYQAKNVPLVNEKGSGLGLALVKHVTEAHGGRVRVKSKVGEGSTFIVELPG